MISKTVWHKGLLTVICLPAVLLALQTDAADTPEIPTDPPEILMEKAQHAFDQADIVNAMSYYRKAAESGYTPAQVRLAYLLDNSEENEAAVSWYRRAAEQGDAEGMYGLAQMLAAGEGVQQDDQQAVAWYTQAARKGYQPAIRVLALAYEKGELELNVSYVQAVSWLNAGVAASDTWSIKRLARAYRKGELGLRIDHEQAGLLDSGLTPEATGSAGP